MRSFDNEVVEVVNNTVVAVHLDNIGVGVQDMVVDAHNVGSEVLDKIVVGVHNNMVVVIHNVGLEVAADDTVLADAKI